MVTLLGCDYVLTTQFSGVSVTLWLCHEKCRKLSFSVPQNVAFDAGRRLFFHLLASIQTRSCFMLRLMVPSTFSDLISRQVSDCSSP